MPLTNVSTELNCQVHISQKRPLTKANEANSPISAPCFPFIPILSLLYRFPSFMFGERRKVQPVYCKIAGTCRLCHR